MSASGVTKTDYTELYPLNYELVFPNGSLAMVVQTAGSGVQAQWVSIPADELSGFFFNTF